MLIKFEWDPQKATNNFKKHGISFGESATVFKDTLSTTFPDTDHSIGENRYLTIGSSNRGRLLIILTRIGEIEYVLSVNAKQHEEKESFMKNQKGNDELRSEYDFFNMEGGIKGKYAKRYREGTNVVLLSPEVAEAFPTDEAVNEALRMLIRIAKKTPAEVLH